MAEFAARIRAKIKRMRWRAPTPVAAGPAWTAPEINKAKVMHRKATAPQVAPIRPIKPSIKWNPKLLRPDGIPRIKPMQAKFRPPRLPGGSVDIRA
jgi:hypothetical protein